MLKGFELRHVWALFDESGNRATLRDIDIRIAQAKEVKEPITIKRLGFTLAQMEWQREDAAWNGNQN